MPLVTESIYTSPNIVVPLADVQHIERHNPLGLIVVTKHTRWDSDRGHWANNIWIDKAEAEAFLNAWCRYRGELEAESLIDLTPTKTAADSLNDIRADLAEITSEPLKPLEPLLPGETRSEYLKRVG